MEIIETKVKKWGNSFAVIIPKKIIEEESIKEDQNIKVMLLRDSKKALKSSFGIGKKIKRTGQQFKDDSRRELY